MKNRKDLEDMLYKLNKTAIIAIIFILAVTTIIKMFAPISALVITAEIILFLTLIAFGILMLENYKFGVIAEYEKMTHTKLGDREVDYYLNLINNRKLKNKIKAYRT